MQPALPRPVVRVILADDHDLVRSGIKSLLSRIDGVSVVAEARDGHELIALVRQLVPDVVMTDISMPGLDGLTALGQIHLEYPSVRLLVLSSYKTGQFVRQAVSSGACGYLMKDAPLAELEQAVQIVMTTGSYFGSGIAQMLLQPSERAHDDQLTERQVQILTLIAKGRASKEIGFELGISSKTVDIHRARIMERLQVKDIASLTLYAARKGFVQI